MSTRRWLLCCAIVVPVTAVLSGVTVAQRADNPFGPPGGQPAERPRRESAAPRVESPFELLGEPAEATAQRSAAPATAPQPARRQAAAQLAPVPAAADAGQPSCRCLGEDGEAVVKIRAALAAPLRSRGLEYNNNGLEQVASDLAAEYGLPIQLDVSALEDAGLGPDEPVTINIRGVSLQSALHHLLRQHNLTYIIQDEVLLITTPTEAEEHLGICLYDVRDLVAGPQDVGGIDTLRDVIVACVAPDTWTAGGGGTGEIRPLPSGLLVISQTQAVHDEIRELLDVMRQMSGQPPRQAAAAWPASPRLVTRHYMLQITAVGEPGQSQLQSQLRDLIAALVPGQTWGGQQNDGQAKVLTVLPDRVVVRHNDSVQRQVETALVDAGLTTPRQDGERTKAGAKPVGFRGGGGGFFQHREGG